MNKKFFAALASATMAFTASGSIAVFADDFVEENTPVVKPGDVNTDPVVEKVLWNEDNFGGLVNVADATWNGKKPAVDKDGYVTIDSLKAVEKITLQQYFEAEIKGLEYFTGLTSFDASNGVKVENEKLDFSANTKLETLIVKKAPDLAEIVLPEAFVNDKEEEVYSLGTLTLEGTKLTSLDLSAQEKLVEDGSIVVTGNKNLKEVTLKSVTSATPAKVTTLNLSDNALETVNLENYTIGTLDLSKNHIGALNLTKTTANEAYLNEQTFYVYEKAANVNLKDAFSNLDVDYVKVKDGFDSKTGVLDLAKATEYEYVTSLKGKATNKRLEVKLEAANPMNRLYNPNSGEHFYTVDVKEKEALVNLGWNDEGYGWVAPQKAAGDKAVYRLYNPNAGDHHYTMSEEERDTLVAFGWKDEGTGWYSAEDTSHNDKKVPVYRQYNPYANGAGSHNYTTDKAESNYLVSLGWIYEGTAWTALR